MKQKDTANHTGGKYLRSGQAARKRQRAKRRRFGKTVILIILLLLTSMALAGIFRGREKKEEPETTKETTVATTEAVTAAPETTAPELERPTPVRPAPAGDPCDADDLLSLENHLSTVDIPTETGCTSLPYIRTVDENGTISGGEYDPDLAGDDIPRITIQYEPDCTFKIASYSVWTHACTYKQATWEDVQRKNTIIVYGAYDSDNILHADKVYILDRLM